MEISILSQNNHFLINRFTYQLCKILFYSGYSVTLFRTNATAKGRKTGKLSALSELMTLFGLRFAIRAVLEYLTSCALFSHDRMLKFARIIEVDDSTKFDEDFIRSNTTDRKVLLVFAGTRILQPEVLALWDHGALNVHSSILPYARGMMPAMWTYHHGKGMGVTLFRLDSGIDTGEIIQQVPVSRRPQSYLEHLQVTKSLGVLLLVNWVFRNLPIQPIDQNLSPSYFRYPSPDFRMAR